MLMKELKEQKKSLQAGKDKNMFFNRGRSEKSVSELRHELIDDAFALAIGGGCPEAILEVDDIKRMSDEEVRKVTKRRGLL